MKKYSMEWYELKKKELPKVRANICKTTPQRKGESLEKWFERINKKYSQSEKSLFK